MNTGDYTLENSLHKQISTKRLWIFRILGLVTAVVFIIFRYVLPEDAYDPMWLRFIIAGVLGSGVGLSLLLPNLFLRYLTELSFLTLLLIASWIVFLVGKNEFMPEYVLAYFVILFSSIVVFSNRNGLIVFSIANIVVGIGMILAVPDPQLSPLLFMGSMALTFLMSFIAFGFLLKANKEAFQREESLLALTQVAFEANKEGICVASANGVLLKYNNQFKAIWGLSDAELAENSLSEIMKMTAGQLKDPLDFAQGIHLLWPTGKKITVVSLKDGRKLEIYSSEIPSNQELKGEVYFFREMPTISPKVNKQQ